MLFHAVRLLAYAAPHLIRDIFITQQPNKSGVYVLQLHLDGGIQSPVIVDDLVSQNALSSCENNQIWVQLLEKALKKVTQNSHSKELSDYLQLMTGF